MFPCVQLSVNFQFQMVINWGGDGFIFSKQLVNKMTFVWATYVNNFYEY